MLNRNAIAKTEKSECLLKRLCKTTLEKTIPLQIGTVVEVIVGQFVEWPTLDRLSIFRAMLSNVRNLTRGKADRHHSKGKCESSE